MKQQSAGRHVASLRHIILIPSQPIFALSSESCVLSAEIANTNVMVFGLQTVEDGDLESDIQITEVVEAVNSENSE
jgi:hypothetical protein